MIGDLALTCADTRVKYLDMKKIAAQLEGGDFSSAVSLRLRLVGFNFLFRGSPAVAEKFQDAARKSQEQGDFEKEQNESTPPAAAAFLLRDDRHIYRLLRR